MAAYPTIALKYFDCRGRAQFIRYYLSCRDIPFEDDRVPLSADFAEWREIRDSRSIVGPFHKLPVLRWAERLIAETTVIGGFLHEASGDAKSLSDDENLRHTMLISSAYVDLMMPRGILLWADGMLPGVELGALATRTLERIRSQLLALDRTLVEWRWLDRGAGPAVAVADCMLWEEISATRHVFGEALNLDGMPAVRRFFEECPGRPAFERVLATRPCQLTGRPGEAAVIEKLRALTTDA